MELIHYLRKDTIEEKENYIERRKIMADKVRDLRSALELLKTMKDQYNRNRM